MCFKEQEVMMFAVALPNEIVKLYLAWSPNV